MTRVTFQTSWSRAHYSHRTRRILSQLSHCAWTKHHPRSRDGNSNTVRPHLYLNGLFAMSDVPVPNPIKPHHGNAILVNGAQGPALQKLIDEGDSGAAAAVKLGEDPTRFLSTIQIGITSIGVLNGIVGEAALAAPLAAWLTPGRAHAVRQLRGHRLGGGAHHLLLDRGWRTGAQAHRPVHPETFARLVARPINLLALATKPFVLLLSTSTRTLLRLLGVKETSGSPVTEEEIHAMLVEGTTPA
jgi:putative hemolysin